MRVWGVVGWKNSGKTGLVTRLVEEFTGRGMKVSTLKHADSSARLDQEGSDTDRHRVAGAKQVILATDVGWSMVTMAKEPPLARLLAALEPVDVVLVEGFKRAVIDKIEAHRKASSEGVLAPSDHRIRAIASDTDLALDRPVFKLDDTKGIADFLLNW